MARAQTNAAFSVSQNSEMESSRSKGQAEDGHRFVLEYLLSDGQDSSSRLMPGHVWKAFKKWMGGFSAKNLKVGGQVFLSFVIFLGITSPLPVWDALSYGTMVPPVACIYMVMLGVQGGTMGNITLFQVYMIFSIILSGLLATLIKYLTWLAAGNDWSNNNVSKGATYVVLVSLSCGIFNILRWTWDATNMFFYTLSIFLIFNLGAYSGVGSELFYLTPVWVLVNIGIGTIITTMCSWFFFPVLASDSFRNATAEGIKRLANAVRSSTELILSPVDPESGLLQDATGKIDVITWRDKGLWDKTQKIAIDQRGVKSIIMGTRGLRIPVLLEFDFYSPKRFRFPIVPFLHVQTYSQIMASVIANMVRPVKSGNLNMRLVQDEDIRTAILNLSNALESVLEAISLSIKDTSMHPWSHVDTLLEESHSCWMQFLRLGQKQLRNSSDEEECFALRAISIFLFNIGSSLREVFFSSSIAIYKEDINSLKLSLDRLRRRPYWITSRTAYTNLDKDPEELTSILAPMPEEETDMELLLKGNEVYIYEAQNSGAFKKVLNSAFGLTSSSVMRPKRAFKVPIWFIVGLQYAVSVAIALTLSVIPAVSDNVFHGRGADVIFTVVVMWQPNIGSTTTRAFNRTLGTAMGAVWSYLLLAITYGVTGTTWSDSAQKWIVSGFLASFWAFFCTINGTRYTAYAYMWFVAGFTVPLVCQTLLREPSPPWAAVGERLLNVIIGIFINWLISMIVFPISAYRMAKENYASSCSAIGTLLYSLPGLFESIPDGSKDNACEMTYFSAMRALEKTFGTKALYHPFKNKDFAASMSLTNRCRRLLADVSALIGPAEQESLLFRVPHRIPKGRITPSIDASHLLIDFIVQILALKLDFYPGEPWKLPEKLYDALIHTFHELASSLDQLDAAAHKGGNTIEIAIQRLFDAEKSVEDLIKLSYQMLEDLDHLPPDEQQILSNAEILLVYISISMFQQIKSVIYASSRAFMFTHATATSQAEDAANAEDFLSQLDHGAETLIGMLMELSISHTAQVVTDPDLRKQDNDFNFGMQPESTQLIAKRAASDPVWNKNDASGALQKAKEYLRRLQHKSV